MILTLEQAREITRDPVKLAVLISVPYDAWGGRCHEISLKILKTGLLGPGRIARGYTTGVLSQHSWIVLNPGGEPDSCFPYAYRPDAIIVDPTLRTCVPGAGGICVTTRDLTEPGRHVPHGDGSIWEYGRPPEPSGEIIDLTPATPLSQEALIFLDECAGPLDRRGWSALIHSPVSGWPSAEIIAAIDDTEKLRALIPVDILGMVTDRNPGNLYW